MEYLFIIIKSFFKRHAGLCLILVLVLVIGFGLISIGHGAPVTYTANNGFSGGGVLSPLNYVLDFLLLLVKLMGRLLLWFIGILGAIFTYNEFSTMKAVQVGWPLVRDLANIFFVVILLLIGFATILRISAYEYKKLLLKFVLMALLINFSKTIFLFAIDASQVIMLTFVSAFKEAMVVNLVSGFGINQVLSMDSGVLADFGNIISALILALIMMIVATGTMVAYVAVLLNRIITLWILLILSPLPFLLSIVPKGSQYAGEIWKKLTKELTTGIALGFFMWLSMTILSYGVASQISMGSPADPIQGSGIKFETLSTFIVCIALLWIGLSMAAKAGGLGGMVAGKVSGALKGTGKGALLGAAGIGGAYSLRNVAGGVKNWRAQRKEASKEKWARKAEKLGGSLNKAQMFATTAAAKPFKKAAELGQKVTKKVWDSGAAGKVGLSAVGGGAAIAGLAALGPVGWVIGAAIAHRAIKNRPGYKSLVKKANDFTGRNASMSNLGQLNKIQDKERKRTSEDIRLRGEQANDIRAHEISPLEETELKRLKKKDEEAKKNPNNPTIQLTQSESDQLVALTNKEKAANNAALKASGYNDQLGSSLSGAKDAKEIEEILNSIPRKLREEVAQNLKMENLQTNGGLDTSKLEAFLKTTKAAHKIEGIDGGETLKGMLADDPALVKSIGSQAWSSAGVHRAVIGSGIDSKYIDDLTPDQRNKFKLGSKELLASEYSQPQHLNPGNAEGDLKSASFKARNTSLSAGNIEAFSDNRITQKAAPQFIEAIKKGAIKASSFKYVAADDVSDGKLDAIIENMKAESIAKLHEANEKLYSRVIDRFQAKYNLTGTTTHKKWAGNNILKQYAA